MLLEGVQNEIVIYRAYCKSQTLMLSNPKWSDLIRKLTNEINAEGVNSKRTYF